jgi:hypothetical protein
LEDFFPVPAVIEGCRRDTAQVLATDFARSSQDEIIRPSPYPLRTSAFLQRAERIKYTADTIFGIANIIFDCYPLRRQSFLTEPLFGYASLAGLGMIGMIVRPRTE